MTTIQQSSRAYEAWLKRQIRGDIVRVDIASKHQKMRDSAFVFLRATFWRWVETILEICPDLASAPAVLAVGDIHLENYGTWRDVEGRLAWGVNDFDEAAEMPYALDLVRLATSAMLTGTASSAAACDALLEGYAQGLRARSRSRSIATTRCCVSSWRSARRSGPSSSTRLPKRWPSRRGRPSATAPLW